MHSKGFLHRDLKPDNFLMGLGPQQHIVHVIDLGLAKRYRDSKTGEHIPYRDGKSLTGTARYASLNTHLGIEQSRRDDLESLGYVLMYWIRGELPWQHISAKSKEETYEKIKQLKCTSCYEKMCAGCPVELATYLKYCTALRFEEAPDYRYLTTLLKNLFTRSRFKQDGLYDWTILRHKSSIMLPYAVCKTESSPSKSIQSVQTPRAEDYKEASPSGFTSAIADVLRFPFRTESSPLHTPRSPQG